MSKQITFFGNRLQTAGHTYKFEVDDGTRILRFSVFSQKPLEEKLVKTRPLPKENKGDLQPEVNKIKSAILQGQGGVIAVIYEENRNRYLWTIPVSSQSESAFGFVGILRPGHPSLDLEPLQPTKGVVPLPAGSHALIPVDLEAEKRLRGFQEHLRYLPADSEALVLQSLRDPSLELRVGLLEAVVRKDTIEPSAGEGWFQRSKRHVPVWPVAATVLGLMLLINSVLLYRSLPHAETTTKTTSSDTDQKESQEEKDKDEQPGSPDNSEKVVFEKIFAVVEAARDKGKSETFKSFETLANNHFSGVKSEMDVSTLLDRGAGGPSDSESLVRGLLKLEAYRLDPTKVSLFDPANNPTAVYNFYKNASLDGTSRAMLAALLCRVYQIPALKKPGSSEPARFAPVDQDCQSYPFDKASAGLDKLLESLRAAS